MTQESVEYECMYVCMYACILYNDSDEYQLPRTEDRSHITTITHSESRYSNFGIYLSTNHSLMMTMITIISLLPLYWLEVVYVRLSLSLSLCLPPPLLLLLLNHC